MAEINFDLYKLSNSIRFIRGELGSLRIPFSIILNNNVLFDILFSVLSSKHYSHNLVAANGKADVTLGCSKLHQEKYSIGISDQRRKFTDGRTLFHKNSEPVRHAG